MAAAFCELLSFPVKGLVSVSSLPVFVSAEWNDSWITDGSPFSYNHGLARVASVLATVSYTDVKDDPESNLMEECYKILGVNKNSMDFFYDVDYSAPILGDNQAAFSFAVKQIESARGTRTLVFVVIRGTPLNANEWISNLAISDTTKKNLIIHEGFLKTMTQVHNALIYFLLKHKIDPDETSFFITGHSRGAAVANLLGAALADESIFSRSKIFAYTFAAPNVSQAENLHDGKYGFIWNIINGEDIVPTVPPCRSEWKFGKYGNTRVIINRWTTDKSKYDDEFYPRMNKIFSQFFLRDYCPFKNGTFVQSQISRILTGVYPDIDSYYNGKFKLRTTAEKIMWKIFPPSSEKVQEQVKSQKQSLFQNISNRINTQTDGGVDYMKNAFTDMHAAETYLSWLFALTEDELFSNLGSVQIILDGYYECAVFDLDGNLLARIIDGLPQYKDIKTPVAAMPIPVKRTVIGFPANEDFDVVIYRPSLIPTNIRAEVETYDCEGRLIKASEKQNLFPHKGVAITFRAGRELLENLKITESKVKGIILKDDIKKGRLQQEDVFIIKPEFSFKIDKQISGGLNFGTKQIYGIALFSTTPEHFGDFMNLAGGLGHQNYLYGNIMLNTEIFGQCVWIFDDEKLSDKNDADTGRFSFIPKARFSISFQPVHRFELFAAATFGFNIDSLNSGYFDSKIQENKIAKINLGDKVRIVPSISFGVKL